MSTVNSSQTVCSMFLNLKIAQVIIVLMLIVLPILGGGCSYLLEPREGDEPSEDVPYWWEEPATPQILSTSLANTWINGSSTMYAELLDETFLFLPDQEDTTGISEKFDDWDYNVELETASLAMLGGDIELTLEEPGDPAFADDPGAAGSTIICRDYILVIPGNEFAPDSANAARGMAKLHLSEDAFGIWRITEWQDIRTASTIENDWGLVRASYR